MKRFYWSAFIGIIGGLAAVAQPLSEAPNAAVLLSRVEARAAHLQDYTVICEDEANGKTTRYKLYFKKPNLVRIDSRKGQVTVQPNGEIRGRLGHGLFGRISRRLRRDDSRLRDADGCPFWDYSYPATLLQIRSQIRAGAGSTLTETSEGFDLKIRSGQTVWRYVIDPETLFFREASRSEGDRPVGITHYRDFHPNMGLEPGVFEF
jgi:hypothetical protein